MHFSFCGLKYFDNSSQKQIFRVFFCYNIILRLWFIQHLTKLLQDFIQYYPKYLAIETKKHLLYGFF